MVNKVSQSLILGFILFLFVYNNSYSQEKKTEESEETVAFQVLKNVPYPDQCKVYLVDLDQMKNCVTNYIGSHVNKNFKLKKFKNYKSGKYKVIVQFKIDKEGEITNVRARTDNADAKLEKEAIRV